MCQPTKIIWHHGKDKVRVGNAKERVCRTGARLGKECLYCRERSWDQEARLQGTRKARPTGMVVGKQKRDWCKSGKLEEQERVEETWQEGQKGAGDWDTSEWNVSDCKVFWSIYYLPTTTSMIILQPRHQLIYPLHLPPFLFDAVDDRIYCPVSWIAP